MKYFLDTEFIERGNKYPLELISIGIISEDGREFYAISSEFEKRHANKWVRENVLPHVTFKVEEIDVFSGGSPRRSWEFSRVMSLKQIVKEIKEFVGLNPEFWGYYADYDWVIFCQLFGSMIDLPEGWPMFCMDLKQLVIERGNPKLPELPPKFGFDIKHHALYDARKIKFRYEWLINMQIISEEF